MHAFLCLLVVLIRTDLILSECSCAKNDPLPNETHSSYSLKSFTVGPCSCSSPFVRKCCSDGFHLNKSFCVRDAAENVALDVPVYDERTRLENFSFENQVNGYMNCESSYLLMPDVESDDMFHIQKDGRMLLNDKIMVEANDYCIENMEGIGFSGLVCHPNEPKMIRLTRHMKSISMLVCKKCSD